MGVLEHAQVADGEWRKRVDSTLDDHRDQLAEFESKFNRGNARFAEGEARMADLERKLDANNLMTSTIQADTKELVTWTKNITGFNSIAKWLGDILLKLAAVIVACGIIYWFLHTGQLPKKADGRATPEAHG